MSRSKIVDHFPRLRTSQFFVTSPDTPMYNCIAWAVGETTKWWWPGKKPQAYWPPNLPRLEHIDSFLALFSSLGYVPCVDGNQERGYEKIALFAGPQGEPKHAARQLANGRWTSKLGPWEDISHTIFGLESSEYGSVLHYMRRPIAQAPQSVTPVTR